MHQDIEAFFYEHPQNYPQFPNDQEKASNILELEELSTLEDENIIEQQSYVDSAIGDQIADACDLIQHMVSEKQMMKESKESHKTFCQEDHECQKNRNYDQFASWYW